MTLAAFAFGSRASAQDGPAGAVQGVFLASPDGDFGAGLLGDLWVPLDMFRIGGFFGVAAVPSAVDARNRIFMPLGVSLALQVPADDVSVAFCARGGLWGGATQEVKLTVGGFVGGGAYLTASLGGGVALTVGMELWGILGDGETLLFAPGLGLSWAPAPAETAPPEAAGP
jgi:hypothetical protein